MVQTFQYWRTDGTLNAAGPGIRILDSDDNYADVEYSYDGAMQQGYPANFAAYAGQNLTWLYATDVGRKVINYLVQGDRITIGFAMLGNNARAASPQASMNRIGYELYQGQRPGDRTRAAFQQRFGHPKGNAFDAALAQFASMINAQPLWDIERRPDDAGGIWSLAQGIADSFVQWANSKPKVSVSIPMGAMSDSEGAPALFNAGGSGLDITGPEVRAWLATGAIPARFGAPMRQQLRLATVVGLPIEQWGVPGGGCNSTVGFAIDPRSEMNQSRPPAIGLAHELVHAYVSAKGNQPGHEGPDDPTTVLFEFRCVGLGPWSSAAISENVFRDQWRMAVNQYKDVMDEPNRRIPGRRVRY